MQKLTLKTVLILGVICFFSISGIFAQTLNKLYIDGKIYFKFKDDKAINYTLNEGVLDIEQVPFLKKAQSKYQITQVKNTFYQTDDAKLHRTFAVQFDNYEMIDAFIAELNARNDIEYAEKCPNFQLHYTPNDADYNADEGNRWHLDAINAEAAWDLEKGDANVVVAVIDNAMWTDHPDLQNKVVDQIDLGDGDNDPTPPTATGTEEMTWSHGTHTSGLVAAESDNGVGVASIGYNVSLMCIKVSRDADGAMAAGFEGITYAADNGADVISMSWGSPQFFQTMQNTIDYAYNKGIVLLASAGNNGNGMSDPNNVNSIMYPAGLNHVVAVGSTDGDDVMSDFSQFGGWIDLCAPGGYQNDGGLIDMLFNNSVYSCAYGSSEYLKMQGTSMSCPIAAGLAGLMLSADPNLTPDKVIQYMKATCVDIDNLQAAERQGKTGAGRINAGAAIQMVIDSINTIYANFIGSATMIAEGGVVDFTDLTDGNPTSWHWTFEGGVPATSTDQDPTNIVYNNAGSFKVTLTVEDATGTSVEIKNDYILVLAPSNSAWIEQVSGFSTQYRGTDYLSIANKDVVWTSAVNGAAMSVEDYYTLDFARTSNGGNTWHTGTITGVPSTYVISSISGLDAQTAWVSFFNNDPNATTDKGGIYKTEDGGQTWEHQSTALFNSSTSFPNMVYFWDENTGWCQGDPDNGYFEMYTTTDGGETWVRVPQGNIPAPQGSGNDIEYGYTGVFEVVGDTIWWGTNKGRILKSVDKGLNWTVTDVSGITDVQDITFNDGNNGMLVQQSYNESTGELDAFHVMYTTDGGTTWAAADSAGMYKSDLDAIPGVPGMFVSVGAQLNNSGSSYTLDFGATWHNIDTAIQYLSTRFVDVNTGWAGGYALSETVGGIYKWNGIMKAVPDTMPVCAGSVLEVYADIKGQLKANNQIIVQLSDKYGSFAQAVNVDTFNIISADTLLVTIPQNTVGGSSYKVRLVSTAPEMISPESKGFITINGAALINAGGVDSICQSEVYVLAPEAENYTSIAWTTTGDGSFTDSIDINTDYTPGTGDIANGFVSLILEANSDCGTVKDTLILYLTNTAYANAGQDQYVCAGESVQLIANGGNTYTWDSDPTLSSTSVQDPIATPTQTTTYYVSVQSSCGTASDSVTVYVYDMPTVSLAANGNTEFCFGEDVELQATSNASIYQWYRDGVLINGAFDATYEASLGGWYKVVSTNANGCSMASDSIEVTVNAVPSANITIDGEAEACDGEIITLEAPTGTGYSYVWYQDGTVISGATSASIDADTTGVYSVTVTNSNGCSDASSAVSLTFHEKPSKPIINASGPNLITPATPGNTCIWYLDGNEITGETNNILQPSQDGDYSVQVVSPEGCVSEMSDTYTFIGINDVRNNNAFVIYPNPATDAVYITFNNSMQINNELQVSVYNTLGKVVVSQNVMVKNNKTRINLNALESGVYFIEFTDGINLFTKKVVIK